MRQSYRELFTIDYREGKDTPQRFYVQIPHDAIPGHIMRVKVNSVERSVRLPDNATPGETIIVTAPAVQSNVPVAQSLP